MSSSPTPLARVLLAKPGLDGHDRGVKLIARVLRDAGFEVVYTGLRQRPDLIAAAAVAEDVDVVGLSVLSGAHLGLTRKTLEALRERGSEDIPVVVGGTIPSGDAPVLREMGVADVFPTGTPLEDVVARIATVAGIVGPEAGGEASRSA